MKFLAMLLAGIAAGFALVSPAQAANAQIKIGASVLDVGMLPLYVADAEGLFKKEGLDVEIVTFQSGSAAGQAIAAGAVNVVYGDLFAVLDSYVGGRDLRAIWSTSNAPSYAWYAPAKYHDLKELKGGKVGVSSIGAMSYYISLWALARAGLDPQKDVSFIGLGSPLARVAALQVGQVDVIPATPPGTFQLERDGYRSLLDLGTLMPEYIDEILYARASTLDRDEDALKKTIRALIHARRWAVDHRDETTKILLKNLGGKDDETAIYRKTVDWQLNYVFDDGHFPDAAIDLAIGFYKDQGKIKEIPPHDKFTDYRFINYFKHNPVK